MAMDFDALGTKTAQDLLVMCGQLPGGPAFPKMKEMWTIVAKNFIQHLAENAEVPAGIDTIGPEGPGKTTGTGRVI
jgi:hypothetical protein